jgi:hypothetical protein
VKTGQVHGKTARRHTSADFIGFLTDLVERNPTGKEIHIVLDNQPAGDRRGGFGLRMWDACRRHLAEFQFFDNAFPGFAFVLERVCGFQRGQIEVAGPGGGIVTGAAVLLNECEDVSGLSCQRHRRQRQNHRERNASH